MPIPLLALAISAFAIGTTEFVIMGLLPEVARDLAVSIPSAGLLVSGYALGVAVGAPLLAVVTSKMPRKLALQLLMGVFIVGNVLCAVASDYSVLMIARVVTSFAHGSFFGIGAVVAASLVPQEKRASAIALMFTGLTLANVLGVPFGTFIGQQFGWRMAFWVVAALGVASLAGHRGAGAEQTRHRTGRSRSRSARAEGSAGLDGAGDDHRGLRRRVRRVHLHRADPRTGERLLAARRHADSRAVRRGSDDRQHGRRQARGPRADAVIDGYSAGARRR